MKRLTPSRRSFSSQPARCATASASAPSRPPRPPVPGSSRRAAAPPPPSRPPTPSSSTGPSSGSRLPPAPRRVPSAGDETPPALFGPPAGVRGASNERATVGAEGFDALGPTRATTWADQRRQGEPSVPLTGLPSFLVPFLPTGATLSSTSTSEPFTLFGSIASMFPAPAVLELPPRPSQAELQKLSYLQGILPLSNWRQHNLIVQQYLDIPSALLTDHVHHQVGLALCKGPTNLDGYKRLDAVVRRMKADGVEVPQRVADKLLRSSTGRKSQINGFNGPEDRISVDRLRERSQPDTERFTASWDALYKDTTPGSRENEILSAAEDPAGATLVGETTGDEVAFRSPHAPMPAPAMKPTKQAFESLLRLPHTAQTFSHLLAQSPMASSAHLPSILSHLHRSYSTVPSHLPDILKDPELELSTKAINEILFAFTSDPNIHLNVPFEAYVAFRRHAAGLPWRRSYIARAAQGMYHNYDDALVSFANPILDSMNYDFPSNAAPDRKTYTTILRAAIYRGDLTLALSVFRDMIEPNGMSLRLPGSPPGRAGRPPRELATFRPVIEDYTQFFAGFVQFAEVHVVSDEARDYWRAHPTAYQRAGGGDVGEVFEEASTREYLWKTWQAGMGAEAEEMEDPYVPGFSGEMPAANQYAVNAATENKRWTLQTLIILFRSFLNLTPGAAYGSRLRPTPSHLPPQPPARTRLHEEAPSSRRILQLLRALHTCSSGHPLVIRSAWEAIEDKFGLGNAEGWVGWRVRPGLERYLGTMGIRPRPWHKGSAGGYEPSE